MGIYEGGLQDLSDRTDLNGCLPTVSQTTFFGAVNEANGRRAWVAELHSLRRGAVF